MIYLFIHQNFPGQYRHLIRSLADSPNNTVYFITQPNSNQLAGVRKLEYTPSRTAQGGCHPFLTEFDDAVRAGLAVADV